VKTENNITDLVLVVSSEIVESNWADVAKQVTARIAAINEDLKTDSDFKEAKKIAADLRQVKKDMVSKKQEALLQAEAVYELFTAIDTMSEECDKKALALEKTITKRNEALKAEKIGAADREIYDYMKLKSSDFQAQRYGNAVYSFEGLKKCIYRKSSFEKMDEALSQYVSESKARADELEQLINANIERLDSVPDEHKTLFQNRVELLGMTPELLNATIEQYIARHEAEELKRKEAKRVADEEAERLATEQAAKQTEIEQPEAQRAEIEQEYKSPESKSPQIDNTPPFGTGSASDKLLNQPSTGSPVSIVKSDSKTETKEESNSFNITIELNCGKQRAQEIAKMVHGRIKNMPEVKNVGLADSTKPNKQIRKILDELGKLGLAHAIQVINYVIQGENNGRC